MRDPYEMLGVAPGAGWEEVRAAYYRAAKTAHPDHGGSDEAMAEVNAARERIEEFLAGRGTYAADDYGPDPGGQQQPPPGGGGGQGPGYNPYGGGYGEARTGADMGEFVMGPDTAMGFAPFGLHFRPEPGAPWHRLTAIPFEAMGYVEALGDEGPAFEIVHPKAGRAETATIGCALLHDPKQLVLRLERLGLQVSANDIVYSYAQPVLDPAAAGRTKTVDVRAHALVARWFREQRPGHRRRMVDRSGWHETPDGWAFAFPDGAVYGVPSVVLRDPKDDPDRDAAWVPRGTSDDWRREVAARAANNPWCMACIGLAFSGPLLAHLRNRPGGGLNGHGESSIGKSIGVAAGASVYGLGATGGVVLGWNGSPSAMEEAAAATCDIGMFLDDMALADTKTDVVAVIYAVANTAARGRWRQPRLFWRTQMASTAEFPLAQFLGRHMTGGLDTRLPSLHVELPGKTSFVNIHGAPDHATFARALEAACQTTYGSVGREWVAFLADHYLNAGRREELTDLLEGRVAAFVARHATEQRQGQADRVARRLGLYAAAAELAAEHGVLPWPAGAATAAMAALLRGWTEKRGTAGSSRDRQGVEAIARYVLLHPGRFPRPGVVGKNDTLGWRETTVEGEQVLMLDAQWQELCRRCGVPDPWRAAAVLADRGFMPRKGSNIGAQRTVSPYKRQWMKVLLPAFLHLGGTLGPDPDRDDPDRDLDRVAHGRDENGQRQ